MVRMFARPMATFISSALRTYNSGVNMSFHTPEKVKMAMAPSAGLLIGKIRRQNKLQSPQPSRRADSSISVGIVIMN